jgi:hypothetical protein
MSEKSRRAQDTKKRSHRCGAFEALWCSCFFFWYQDVTVLQKYNSLLDDGMKRVVSTGFQVFASSATEKNGAGQALNRRPNALK